MRHFVAELRSMGGLAITIAMQAETERSLGSYNL